MTFDSWKKREDGKAGKNRRRYPAGRRVFAGAVLLIGAFVLQTAARNLEGFGQWYAVTVYPVLVGTFGRFFGIFPFSASELGLYLLLLGILWYASGISGARQRL